MTDYFINLSMNISKNENMFETESRKELPIKDPSNILI